jgi:hypothetical protein
MNRTLNCRIVALSIILCLSIFSSWAKPAAPEFQIKKPAANSVVAGEVIEVSGVGADPTGTVEIAVLTDKWYVQDGDARINADGTWTFSPVHLGGKEAYNNHTIRATIIKDSRRGKSVTVSGIVRRQ